MSTPLYYSADWPVPTPTVDHMHERLHQHQTLLQYLMHKRPNNTALPNHPDIDLQDCVDHYSVHIELPGIKDASQIKCEWTGPMNLVVSGSIDRPQEGRRGETCEIKQGSSAAQQANGRVEPTAESQASDKVGGVATEQTGYLLIGERRIGGFSRHLSFPASVDAEATAAKLEAGLLSIRIPKKKLNTSKGTGPVSIEVCP